MTATHTMDAFSRDIYRDMKIHGTKGELVGIMEKNLLELRLFGGKVERIAIDKNAIENGHGGGDDGLMREIYRAYNGLPTRSLTYLQDSIESHKMAFSAEKARATESTVDLR